MSEKSDKTKSGNQTRHVPKDAQVIMSIMKDMGISDYEPRVINQLLEFTYRYVSCIMDDARVFANHAKKKVIDIDDVRLAVQMQLDKSFTTPPPREVLLEVARSKNIIPLPLVKPHCGLRLPPDRYCLSACNYRLKAATKKTAPKPTVVTQSPKILPSKPLHSSVVKRQGPLPSGPAKVTTAPKPVLKFSSGSKVVAKPAIRVTSGPSVPGATIKMEVDLDSGPNKRKRDDDYDVL